jgi:hypothetical protein
MIADQTNTHKEPPTDILHPGSRALFRYWESIRGERAAPARGDIDLKKIREYVPWLYIAETHGPTRGYRWRLAGGRLCEMWRKELTGTAMFAGWESFERDTAKRLFDGVTQALQPCAIRLRLLTSLGHAIGTELIGLPVVARDGTIHIFGAVMPFRDAASFGYDRISAVEIASARTIWTEPLPGDAIATTRGKPAPLFQVIPGGRNPH